MVRFALPVCLGLMLVVAACAETVKGQAQAVSGPAGPAQRVEIEASNYQFKPNEIAVVAGEPVEVTVRNVTDTGHNITIKNPQGRKLVAQDLPPSSTRTVVFTPEQPGKYEFYCDKDLHAALGMMGAFNASRPGGAGS